MVQPDRPNRPSRSRAKPALRAYPHPSHLSLVPLTPARDLLFAPLSRPRFRRRVPPSHVAILANTYPINNRYTPRKLRLGPLHCIITRASPFRP
jgi:hypothetical protein